MRIALKSRRFDILLVLLLAAAVWLAFGGSLRLSDLSIPVSDSMQSFKTIFISIVLEALPFILLGVVLSSLLQEFVSEQLISRIVPKNPLPGILFGCVLGIVLPICECGLIPVVRRLIRKGMPLYVAVVFILSGPIINPVVFAATYMAFRSRPEMAFARMGIAFCVAGLIGLYIYCWIRKPQLRAESSHTQLHHHTHNHTHSHEHHDDHAHHSVDTRLSLGAKLSSVCSHSIDEFFDMGKYLIFGSIVTALVQTFVVRESLIGIGHGENSSHLFMMGFAYILSLCSTSDAFVASSFANTFTTGSLLTFLVFGPMLDFKGTLMLLSAFKTRFVLLLMLMIVLTVFVVSKLTESFFFI